LIESSRTQQREVPALLYSVNAVWFMMASADHFKLSNSMLPPTTATNTTNSITEEEHRPTTAAVGSSSSSSSAATLSPNLLRRPDNEKVTTAFRHSASSFIQQNFIRKSHDGFIRLPDDSHITVQQQQTTENTTTDRRHSSVTEEESSNDTDGNTKKVEPAADTEKDEEDGNFYK
jgi:hypothetical protein